jgi:hypothetical protein
VDGSDYNVRTWFTLYRASVASCLMLIHANGLRSSTGFDHGHDDEKIEQMTREKCTIFFQYWSSCGPLCNHQARLAWRGLMAFLFH